MRGTRGSRRGRGRELFASCACGNVRPHHLFFLPHCAQRSGGPFYLIDSGRLTHRLPASNAALAARPRWAVAASPPEMVPPSGTREKSPGPGSSFAYLKLKGAPAPYKAFRDASSPSPNLPSWKKGFTGKHGSPVKSRAARGAVPHCISAEMPRLWGAGSTSPWGRNVCALRAQNRVWPRAAGIPRPARGRKLPSPPAAEISRPRPWAESPFSGKRNRGRQSLRRLRRQLPLHKGAIFGAASPQGGNPAVRRMFKRLERFLRGAPSGRKEQARPAGKEVLCNTLM